MNDPSHGWEAVAERFAAMRSEVGADVVRRWAGDLPAGGSVVDIGCGTGRPIALALAGAGLAVSGIDPSPTLLAAFRHALPHAPASCETAEDSGYFGRRFDGAVAIGLLFLLPPATQAVVIDRVARALRPGGRFLFSAPAIACCWTDTLTGRVSQSLGGEGYRALLDQAGLRLTDEYDDAGGNHYFAAVGPGVGADGPDRLVPIVAGKRRDPGSSPG
ncbi:class I SAM-dependent methyltransferase [Sphingomonas panni]|uniref:class I SAM-dependent methyltransferase n=1 Tax=Sphingomonas panni TaxID=237612 RepID=UPI001F5B38FF|nr:class I SAM-dependent methyltransferase [Sphingomonas panni]